MFQSRNRHFIIRSLAALCLAGILLLAVQGVKGTSAVEVAIPTTKAECVHLKILEGLDALYNGNFPDARRIFTEVTQHFPNDARGYFFLALTYRWLTRIDPDSETYQELFEITIEQSIQLCKTLIETNQNHADATLYLAASYGYRAEYYNFLKHNWKKAYDDGVKMRDYLEKANKFHGANIDIQLGYALYNYYAYLYRDQIGWWRFLLSLPKGDKEKGIETLTRLRRDGVYTNIEAWYFLIEIYKDEHATKEQAIALSEELHRTYPNNPFFHTLLAGVYHKFHDWENSLRVSREIVKQAHEQSYYSDYLVFQAKYLIGESLFFIGDYKNALTMFDEIIRSHPEKPRYLLPWSHLRRGTIYNITKRKKQAREELQVVLKMKDVLDVHKLAKALLKAVKEEDE
ncbi:hypothetical protein CSA56_10115 [candidate division KSB3 bacterium]|uniref:Tetratricopeptide repeat protein n=1 Tax=candidate division KSB3 bacterium TaxID=2044937 RepID=A0A2G6KDX8_9BACT|nr:MAG: hypothetical protein CSA56_10115 [candidate division KSB3 bacterium]